MARSTQLPFVVLCGPSGVGKSTLRQLLAEKTGAVSLGPDDFEGDWSAVYSALDRADRAIVECCRLPRALRDRAQKRGARIIELSAPEQVRMRRLIDRGETPTAVRSRLAEDTGGLGYEDEVMPNLTLDATEDPEALASTLAGALP